MVNPKVNDDEIDEGMSLRSHQSGVQSFDIVWKAVWSEGNAVCSVNVNQRQFTEAIRDQ